MNDWHIITPEFPPQTGGVADYAQQVAQALMEAGDRVDVWCSGLQEGFTAQDPAWLHRDMGRFGPRSLAAASRRMKRGAARPCLFVQWVPHGYGCRSMNIGFCLWLWIRSLRGDRIELMVHEPFLGFREGTLRQDLVALIHRFMTIVLLRAATRVWLSTLAWKEKLRPYALGRRVAYHWLPVPSNVPVEEKEKHLTRDSTDRGADGLAFGHFSTHSAEIRNFLRSILPALLDNDCRRTITLLGRGSGEFRREFLEEYPALSDRVIAAGCLPLHEISHRLARFDLLLQPYPDGVTTRRGSIMAGLAHGLPVVTTWGPLSEGLWNESGAVALASASNPDEFVRTAENLARNEPERKRLKSIAAAFYEKQFGLQNTIRKLRAEVCGSA